MNFNGVKIPNPLNVNTYTDPLKTATNQVGNALNTSVGGDSSFGKAATKVAQTTEKAVKNAPKIIKEVTKQSLATAKAFLKNPLPTIETIALTTVMPYPYASAAVSVLNGGDWRKAVIQMGMNYAATGSGGAPASTLEKVLTSSSTAALSAKLLGATSEQVRNAAIGGGVNSYVTDLLYKPKEQGGYGLDPKSVTTKMLTNATSAATNAILRGKNVGDAVIESGMVTAGAYYTQQGYEALTKNSETLQSAQKYLDEAKAKIKGLWTPDLQAKKDKLDLAASNAQDDQTRAKAADAQARKESQSLIDGKTFDPDWVTQTQDFANSTYETQQESVDAYKKAKYDYEYTAITSGYTKAEQEYEIAKTNVQSADNAVQQAENEFLKRYNDYQNTVSNTTTFTNYDIAKMSAEQINKEVQDSAQAAMQKQAEDAKAQQTALAKSQEEAAAQRANPVAPAPAVDKVVTPVTPVTSPAPVTPVTSPSPVTPVTSPSPVTPVTSPSPVAPVTSPSPVAPTKTPEQVEAERKQKEYEDWKVADQKARDDAAKEIADKKAQQEAAAKAQADAEAKAKQDADAKAAQDKQTADAKAAEETKAAEAEKQRLAQQAELDKKSFDAYVAQQGSAAKAAQEAEARAQAERDAQNAEGARLAAERAAKEKADAEAKAAPTSLTPSGSGSANNATITPQTPKAGSEMNDASAVTPTYTTPSGTAFPVGPSETQDKANTAIGSAITSIGTGAAVKGIQQTIAEEKAAKAKAEAEAKRQAAIAQAKAAYEAKVAAQKQAYEQAKAAYQEKLKAQQQAQAEAKAKADALAKAAAAKAAADQSATKPTGTLKPVNTGSTAPTPTGTLTPVTKPTGTLTPVTQPSGTLTPATKPATPSVAPTGGLNAVSTPTNTVTSPVTSPSNTVTSTPANNLPTGSTSTTMTPTTPAKPTGTLKPVTQPTGTLKPVTKPVTMPT